MANSYSPNLKLAEPGSNDRNWGNTLNGNLAAIDALAPVGGLNVARAEVPSASLNVRVAPGTFRQAAGPPYAYPGAATQAVPASATTCLWLTDAGSLATGTAFPTGVAIVPLATVTSNASAITAIVDARVAFDSAGQPASTTAYLPEAGGTMAGVIRTAGLAPAVRTVTAGTTTTPADEVIRADASGGPLTITLATPTASQALRIKKIDATSNAVNVAGTIDGSTSMALTAQYVSRTLIYDPASGTWGVY